MSFASNHRSTIDSEVYKWVVQQLKKKKVVTPNAIRQKAFEIGQEFDPNFKASINWYNNWKKRFDYNESPEAEALKHKKRSYTAAFKLHAVQRAMELESASQASLELDVSRRCLQRWKEELDVIASVAEHSSNAVYRRPGQGRKVRDLGLDTQLLDWVRDCWKQGISLSSIMIREKARELSPQPEFKASLGWFVKWQKRHCVDLKEQTCSPMAGDVMTPLKLRLLPEGEMSAYSTPKKRRLSKKRTLNYDSSALLENDEEFDRLLLTWLVERWEAGDIVNDKMLKERAMELTANPDFKASKVWLTAWKGKYNVSLENQTYGTEGDEENEEIVEETPVYDEQVLIEGEQPVQPEQRGEEGAAENPLTPAKEEAATALASLSADDHEIAEALQKLASAFGITTQSEEGGGGKENVTQLAALQQSDNPEFLLEGGQVAVEEVVSEEVVTDEPLVVIEGTDPSTGVTEMQAGVTSSEDIASSTVQSIVDVVSAATQIAQSITGSSNPSVTQPVAESLIQAVANQLNQTGGGSAFTTAQLQLQGQEAVYTSRAAARLTPAVSAILTTHTLSTPLTATTIPTPSSSLTITTSPSPATPLTLPGPLVLPSSSLTITTAPIPTSTLTISTTPTPSSLLTIATTPGPSLTPADGPPGGLLVPHSSAPFVTEEVIISGSAEVTEQVEVTVEGGDVVMEEGGGECVTGDPSDTIVQLSGTGLPEHTDVHIAMVTTAAVSTASQLWSEVVVTSSPAAAGPSVRPSDLATAGSPEVGVAGSAPELVVALSEEIPLGEGRPNILEGGTDILDIVQETIVEEGEEEEGGGSVEEEEEEGGVSVGEEGGMSVEEEGGVSMEGEEEAGGVRVEGEEEEEGGVSAEGERSERAYEEEFKVQVVRRARELGSVQLAAREFSVPWKVVASWNTGE